MTERLLSTMDNVLAVRLGRVIENAASEVVKNPGDGIDAGLILRRHLEGAGFGVVVIRGGGSEMFAKPENLVD